MDGNYFGHQVPVEEDEALFKNEFEYTKEYLHELYKNMINWDKKRKINFRIILGLLIINLIANVIFISLGNYNLYIVLIITAALIGIIFLMRALEPALLARTAYNGYKKRYNTKMEAKMLFDEDAMTMFDIGFGDVSSRTLPYYKIREVHESENFIVLKFDHRQTAPLLKMAFTKGTLEEFRLFIFNKIKEIEDIKV